MASNFIDCFELYFGVNLTGMKKNVVIPYEWCDSFDWASQLNGGLNRNENHLIFFSSDSTKWPDFSLHVQKGKFDPDNDHCYFGKIIKAFSEYKNEIIIIN